MNTYISLLRGVNVGGSNKIKMAQLKLALDNLGLLDVKTYIQSGNIVYRSKIKDSKKLSTMIHNVIKSEHSFEIPVISFSLPELIAITKVNPNQKEAKELPSKTYFCFLFEKVSVASQNKLRPFAKEEEKFKATGKMIYMFCEAFNKTKLNNNFIERKLNVVATIRNFRTVNKIIEMGKELDNIKGTGKSL